MTWAHAAILQRWLGLEAPLDYEGVQRALSSWQPYAGLVYYHLLLKRQRQAPWIP